MLTNIILATLLVGIIGAVGAYGIVNFFAHEHHKLMFLVSFAAGTMIAVSFFDLLPEALEKNSNLMGLMEFTVIGFLIFLLIEKTFLYYHCHEEDCDTHASKKLIIFGSSVHNFLDGITIAASFMASINVGIFTTLAIIIHEIPHEIGEFGVLMHGGYSKLKALTVNLFTALVAVMGGLAAYYSLNSFKSFIPYVLAFTAGGFIYISATDLLPEIQKSSETRLQIFLHSVIFIVGIVILWLLIKVMAE
ncbi:MAG TPA: ZIP family metal transporter [Candidatus Udaeobacter sp.]|nr:ZIP family metal transporter [Candidatus Udaeobacter sp.]